MDYMMLKPSTNQCMGFVSDKQVRKELGLSRARFNNFVMYQKLYKGCILIEYEDGARTVKSSHTTDGKWVIEKKATFSKCKVVAWMPLPKPYKEKENERY